MATTNDPNDPELHEKTESGQNKKYLVLSDVELAKGFVRPFRSTYIHTVCGVATTMGQALSFTYARDPRFYGSTFCAGCKTHFPVEQFTWSDNSGIVGS